MFTKGDELSSRFSKSSGNLVIGYVRRSRFFFCWFFATLDPLASSLQAPRSSSFQAFKISSLQAFKPSSLFQALKPSSLRGANHSSLRFNWAYRFCKHENLLEGRGEVQPNCIHTFYNHTAQERSVACTSYCGKPGSNSISSSDERPSKSFNISLLPLYKTSLQTSGQPYSSSQSQSVLQQDVHHCTHLISAPSVMPYNARGCQYLSGSITLIPDSAPAICVGSRKNNCWCLNGMRSI